MADQEKITFDTYAFVIVKWHDHHTFTEDSWVPISKIVKDSREPVICYTGGWLLDDNEDYVLLAQTLTEDGDCTETMKVLRPSLDEIKVIRKARKVK